MKKLLLLGVLPLLALAVSCSKVEQPVPAQMQSNDPYDLYPYGDSAHYAQNAWPTFTQNTNTDRNVLIEDYTGHNCKYCPNAAVTAEAVTANYPGRITTVSIHAGPNGTGMFNTVAPNLPLVLYNNISDALGKYFGVDWPGSTFVGLPNGAVSRADHGSGTPITHPSNWDQAANNLISANDLKVNLQASSNYYASTQGLFLHTEVEVLDQSLTNELRIVAYLIEDEKIGPQLLPSNQIDPLYAHKDILRASLDGSVFGQQLDAAHLDANGKYYFNYIYALPSGYDDTNSHVVIYVRDAVTEEVYQVIKHGF